MELQHSHDEQELQYRIALTQVKGIGHILGKQLLDIFGSAETVFREVGQMKSQLRGFHARLAEEFRSPLPMLVAEHEVEFIRKHRIEPLFITDKCYPERLRDLADAPLMLYYRGSADLNKDRSYSVVGTRKPTAYGREVSDYFVKTIARLSGAPLVVSGLAYGVDVAAHRAALESRSESVAVLAHGLDLIYPAAHRNLAKQMVAQGGLLTEYVSGTQPERYNFVARNRIVALLTRSTIVVESAAKGGSLITAGIAQSYGREVFALPGRVTDSVSQGCLELIRRQKAQLLSTPEQFVEEMAWGDQSAVERRGVQPGLFDQQELSGDQQRLVSLLQERGALHVNELAALSEMPFPKLSPTLLELEFKGVVRALPGGIYEKR